MQSPWGSFIPLSLAERALPINLNTAAVVDIAEAIHGVGEVRAAAIISLREELGRFNMLEKLPDVKGISEVTFTRIRSIIVLE